MLECSYFLSVITEQASSLLCVKVSVYDILIFVAVTTLILIVIFAKRGRFFSHNFEINTTEIGLGLGKVIIKPNTTTRQIAYSIWVELSTRKIGLPIDFEHDVIVEIYNSWYQFFSITRELIKSIPISQARNSNNQEIINLSIEILNEGLRPHLTRWQARFRTWYEHEISIAKGNNQSPQEIQRKFPDYDSLKADMEDINKKLISYRDVMKNLTFNS